MTVCNKDTKIKNKVLAVKNTALKLETSVSVCRNDSRNIYITALDLLFKHNHCYSQDRQSFLCSTELWFFSRTQILIQSWD